MVYQNRCNVYNGIMRLPREAYSKNRYHGNTNGNCTTNTNYYHHYQ